MSLFSLLDIDWWRQLSSWWAATRSTWIRERFASEEKKLLSTDLKERREIARLFNDRYCMATRFDTSSEEWVPGDPGMFGMPVYKGNRWMCPECNKLHEPLRNSGFVGLIYPQCCGIWEGCRYDSLGPKGLLKRPLGFFGPGALIWRLRKAGLAPTHWKPKQ